MMLPMIMMAMAVAMRERTKGWTRAWGGVGGAGAGADVGEDAVADVDAVVKVDVVEVLLVAVGLTLSSGHPGCLAGIICIGNISVTLS